MSEDTDLNLMSEEERRQFLSSLPLNELLKRAGALKPTPFADGPAWKRLDGHHCHICHKPIKDEKSLRIKIGASDCRPRIERELNRGSGIWEQISQNELEIIWTRFNIYGVYVNGIAHKVIQIHRKGDLIIFDLKDTEMIFVKTSSSMTLTSRDTARKLWVERS